MLMPQRVHAIKNLLSSNDFRSLKPKELEELIQNSNTSTNWGKVLVRSNVTRLATQRVIDCHFNGTVRLGDMEGVDGVLPSGLYRSCLSECFVCDGVRVSNCELIDGVFLGEGARLLGCGIIRKATAECSFGNGMKIPVVVGVGGRDVSIYAEMELDEASQVAALRHDSAMLQEHGYRSESYRASVSLPVMVIDSFAEVVSVDDIHDSFIGAYAKVTSSQVIGSTVLSSSDEPSSICGGSHVKHSLLQSGVRVDTQSIVENSMMYSQSYASNQGKLAESILGPYSGVSEGEISSSLVGPFLGFHHQALLIASYWPMGRGNVGYGANVGSNHTGKAPDQELWHGEGVFYGLGCSIKFPSDFSRAPYSLFATGVVTLPQKITFPFSLISSQAQVRSEVSPAFNVIQPGWILAQNYYTVIRNESKFKSRGNKSQHFSVEFRVLRSDTISLMCQAREELVRATPALFHTDKDVRGIGKNIMTEASRVEAIKVYSYFMVYYAVRGFWESIQQGTNWRLLLTSIKNAPRYYTKLDKHFLATETGVYTKLHQKRMDGDEWELQSTILRVDAPNVIDFEYDTYSEQALVTKLLRWLSAASRSLVDKAFVSKQKDNKRGALIIPGYNDAHGSTLESDTVLSAALKESEFLTNEIESFLTPSKL